MNVCMSNKRTKKGKIERKKERKKDGKKMMKRSNDALSYEIIGQGPTI